MNEIFMYQLALTVVVSAVVGAILVKLFHKRAVAHRGMLAMAAALREHLDLKTIPDILESIAVGELLQAEVDIEFWVRLLQSDPESALKEFDKVFVRVLTKKLSTPDGVAEVKAALDAVTPAIS